MSNKGLVSNKCTLKKTSGGNIQCKSSGYARRSRIVKTVLKTTWGALLVGGQSIIQVLSMKREVQPG